MHLEAFEIAGAGHDQRLDGISSKLVTGLRIVGRILWIFSLIAGSPIIGIQNVATAEAASGRPTVHESSKLVAAIPS